MGMSWLGTTVIKKANLRLDGDAPEGGASAACYLRIKTMNKKAILGVALVCLSVILFSCKEKVTFRYSEEGSKEYNFLKFIEGIKAFPYEATSEKRRRVTEGFSNVSLGMNKGQIKDLLGTPDAEFFSYDTTKVKTYIGSSWTYYLHRHEAEYGNAQYDQVVTVYFDPKETLYWAHLVNIDSLKDKGAPQLQRR